MERREVIKSLATLPFVGALFYGWYKKNQIDSLSIDTKKKRS